MSCFHVTLAASFDIKLYGVLISGCVVYLELLSLTGCIVCLSACCPSNRLLLVLLSPLSAVFCVQHTPGERDVVLPAEDVSVHFLFIYFTEDKTYLCRKWGEEYQDSTTLGRVGAPRRNLCR